MTVTQATFPSLLAVASLLVAAIAHGQSRTPAVPEATTNTLQLRGAHILVEDVPKTVAFYERAFGATLKYLHPTKGYAELATGEVLLAFISEKFLETTQLLGPTLWHRNRSGREASGSQLVFVSTNLEADFARAISAGAVVIKRPEPKPWGQTVGYLRDLNGYMLELCSPQTRP
jgi:uncharacterized glyoxalase superfamily protein PhnB